VESCHARGTWGSGQEQNLRARVTATRQEGSWLQMGLHGEAKPGRSGGALQNPIGSKVIQSDL
jgi:hypothetical protein